MGESRNDSCKWLHQILQQRPLIRYPFTLESLPRNGIYFFYEINETWGHGGEVPRIVRVGTHRSQNFRSRINEHFLTNDRWMNFDTTKPAPKDRSIFRKNLGRALINQENPRYLDVWNIDFTTRENKKNFSHLREIEYEKRIERKITELLRSQFSFRYLEITDEKERIGHKGLENRLIGTIAQCPVCGPSDNWIGKHSPSKKIMKSGLWQVQHLSSPSITLNDKQTILSVRARISTESEMEVKSKDSDV